MNPEFPVVSGRHQLTEEWWIELPVEFNRRIEDGDLCLWRPGATIWISVWGKADEPLDKTLAWLREDIDPEGFDVVEELDGRVGRIRYRLDEESEDKRAPAFYGFVVQPESHLQFAAYVDAEDDVELVGAVFEALGPESQTED